MNTRTQELVRFAKGHGAPPAIVAALSGEPPPFTFGPHDGPGDACVIEFDGFTICARIETDPDGGKPWEREDGHGEVSGWRSLESKRPGELVMICDGRSCRFYDYAAACRTARADGWGVAGGQREGETARQYAARAAMADFERLRGWCNDDWTWAGVCVVVARNGVTLTGKYAHALWGIESDAGDYFNEVAAELTGEALADARATLAKLLEA
jgi:hypothetical protein